MMFKKILSLCALLLMALAFASPAALGANVGDGSNSGPCSVKLYASGYSSPVYECLNGTWCSGAFLGSYNYWNGANYKCTVVDAHPAGSGTMSYYYAWAAF